MSSSDQCAVGPNSELLDASEISFFNDWEDDIPLALVTEATSTLLNLLQAMKTCPKAELTKDIQPLFKEEEVLDPDTGLLVKGHWCLLCKRDGVPVKKCFLLGNVSSRQTHIKNVREEQCSPSPSGNTQGFFQVFMLVDKGPFRSLLQYCRPSLKESDIPHCTKMRKEILKCTVDAEERLCLKLQDIPGQVSFTFDTWTSKTGDPFLGVMGHYIDAPADSLEEWSLKSEQLACMEHAVHLTAGHFLSDVSPLSAKAVITKVKKLRKKLMAANPDMDNDELDALLAGDDGNEDAADGEWEDGDKDGPTPKDAVGKALALVKQEPANIQQSFSSSRHPTVWCTLPLLEALAETWRNMAATEKFTDMRESINAGLNNLEKWYGKTDDTDVYFISWSINSDVAEALDPNIKTAYAEESWNSVAFEGLAKLKALV
ncbi:hypothetical protein B0H10DRAFT_1949272 [Mycena sp. CBHHK59/15]|nr:hypothetical protein B0H10DRAFT_1949272 [Mycena sp. CBHHK59/15]